GPELLEPLLYGGRELLPVHIERRCGRLINRYAAPPGGARSRGPFPRPNLLIDWPKWTGLPRRASGDKARRGDRRQRALAARRAFRRPRRRQGSRGRQPDEANWAVLHPGGRNRREEGEGLEDGVRSTGRLAPGGPIAAAPGGHRGGGDPAARG